MTDKIKITIAFLIVVALLIGFSSLLYAQSADVASSTVEPPEFPVLIKFTRTGNAAPVLFRHARHASRARCLKCHGGDKPIFPRGRRATVYKMSRMYQGYTCGSCHNDKKAFRALSSCRRCHKGH